MSLVRAVRAVLDERKTRYILIGAHAAAFYGVIRSTKDIDLFTIDRSVLREDIWSGVGARTTVLSGDALDPLAGTVRFVSGIEQVDLVVGKWKFERAIIERANSRQFGDGMILVPRAADVVLLKVAAGGPQDLWDVHELMNHVDRQAVVEEVDASIDQLPADVRSLWARVRSELT